VSELLAQVLSLSSPWAYVLVGLLAAAEAAAFLGLVIPGETAMLLGGVLASTGHAALGWMMAAGMLGAVAGDSIGYELGRRSSDPLRTSHLGARVGPERWRRAEDYLRTRGGRSVFLGRWVGVLRAMIPFVAGASRMPYRVFLPYNVAGGVLWAATFVIAGYLAGSSYRRVEHIAGRASLVLAGLLLFVAVVVVTGRWVSRHPDRVMAPVRRLTGSAPVRRIAHRYERQIVFLADRFRPGGALGLVLTVELLALGAAGAAFGGVTEDVLRRNELIGLDAPVAQFFTERREPWLTTTMETLTWLGSAWVLAPVVVAVGLVVGRRLRSWQPLIFLVLVLGGSTVLAQAIKLVVARPRPDAGLVRALGYSFPSGHSTAAAAGWLAVALVLCLVVQRWDARVAVVTVAVIITLLVGVSRVYLGVHEPTDVLGGWALGAMWVAATAAAMRVYGAVAGPAASHGGPGQRLRAGP
jgi:membrane protein DedA with SNARE-associated domain/membrane-associated phospholipid phosphatase